MGIFFWYTLLWISYTLKGYVVKFWKPQDSFLRETISDVQNRMIDSIWGQFRKFGGKWNQKRLHSFCKLPEAPLHKDRVRSFQLCEYIPSRGDLVILGGGVYSAILCCGLACDLFWSVDRSDIFYFLSLGHKASRCLLSESVLCRDKAWTSLPGGERPSCFIQLCWSRCGSADGNCVSLSWLSQINLFFF